MTILLSLRAITANTLLLSSIVSTTQAVSRSEYTRNSQNAADVLNKDWYDDSTGKWEDLWWQSANMITTLAELSALGDDLLQRYNPYFEKTFVAAPATNGDTFLNDFYDDEAWWALGWIQTYDVTKNASYLNSARGIFADLANGNDATCGGHWWDKSKTQNNAIVNALYTAVAGALALRVKDSQQEYYQDAAVKQWKWFKDSGLINDQNTINDKLDLNTCDPTGLVYTYNQGVILGALVDLHTLTSDQNYLDTASTIAHAAMDALTDDDGILLEPACPEDPDVTCAQFKGIFTRNLMYLQKAAGDDAYVEFLQKNADSIWENDRSDDGQLGAYWPGPFSTSSAADQSSALDCLVAAAAVSS